VVLVCEYVQSKRSKSGLGSQEAVSSSQLMILKY